MATFCCPIEMEPRTLKAGQLNHARKVATDIVQNKDQNEASNTFVEGLKPGDASNGMIGIVKENSAVCSTFNDCKIMNNGTTSVCQCSSIDTLFHSPDVHSKFKEPFSAPF